MRDGFQAEVNPWSFFLPVALAVAVGVLAAWLVQRSVEAVLEDDAVEVTDDTARVAKPSTTGDEGAAPAQKEPVSEDAAESTATASPREPERPEPGAGNASAAPQVPAVPILPGAIVAKRDGAPEACINGSIATRAEYGWEQRLENDAPVPCIEQSGVPR